MDALLVRERYKVVRVIDSREDYAFAEAVDILDRETGSCLLNLYEGPLLRRYLPCFDHLKGLSLIHICGPRHRGHDHARRHPGE